MITANNVSLCYGEKKILNNLNFTLQDDKITVILGESGSGKTSILNMLAGKLQYEGNISDVPERISYVYQGLRLIPSITVYQNVEFVLLSLMKKEQIPAVVENVLRVVELWDYKDKYPKELSGGMAQRVALARAFSYQSKLLLLDEPFTALDVSLKKRLIVVLLDLLTMQPKTTVLVTHSIDEALLLADTILILDKSCGSICRQISIDIPQQQRTLSDNALAIHRQQIFSALKI